MTSFFNLGRILYAPKTVFVFDFVHLGKLSEKNIVKVLWESAGAFFPRDNSHFTRQVARFTRSWSSGKMLAFQPRGFVFERVGMC